jgi:hypothetical protein
MSVKLISQYTLYRSKRFYSAFPSVATLPSGEVALAFRRAPDHRWLLGDMAEEDMNKIDHVHFRSHIAFGLLNNQLTLDAEPQILPVDAESGDQDGNLFVSRSGRLFQYSFLWYPVTKEISDALAQQGMKTNGGEHLGGGFIFSGAYVRFSDDNGGNWSSPFRLPLDPIANPRRYPDVQGTAALRGQMVESEDGTLLLAAYCGGLGGYSHDSVRILRSDDFGESWFYTDQHIKSEDWALQEPTLVPWPEGKITAFCRTQNNEDQLVISQAASSPNRLVFESPQSVGVVGHPYNGLVLPDGRLFLCYGYRHAPMGTRARLVEPGETLEQAEEIIIRDDSASKDTGYPAVTLLPDGRIMVAYYISDEKGIRGIEASLLEVD